MNGRGGTCEGASLFYVMEISPEGCVHNVRRSGSSGCQVAAHSVIVPGHISCLSSLTVSRSAVSSVTTDPSNRLIVRRAYDASRWEWVTITIVVPSRLSEVSSSITSRPLDESRLPVGSSARSITGSPTMALAIATRCCCPPDSCCG